MKLSWTGYHEPKLFFSPNTEVRLYLLELNVFYLTLILMHVHIFFVKFIPSEHVFFFVLAVIYSIIFFLSNIIFAFFHKISTFTSTWSSIFKKRKSFPLSSLNNPLSFKFYKIKVQFNFVFYFFTRREIKQEIIKACFIFLIVFFFLLLPSFLFDFRFISSLRSSNCILISVPCCLILGDVTQSVGYK